MAPAGLVTGGRRAQGRGRLRYPGRWVGLLVLIGLGMVVVLVWGDDLRPHVHAFLSNVLRRI
ncbi:hypothetical protein [Cellulomonas sp. NPDC058312]|uniref:hypothetical protein n=1 Tax=Cellulomonas sp. NPDC058312 TaxID=3346441 RepID=UPI0036E93DE2